MSVCSPLRNSLHCRGSRGAFRREEYIAGSPKGTPRLDERTRPLCISALDALRSANFSLSGCKEERTLKFVFSFVSKQLKQTFHTPHTVPISVQSKSGQAKSRLTEYELTSPSSWQKYF